MLTRWQAMVKPGAHPWKLLVLARSLDYYTVRYTEQCGLCFFLDKSGSLCTVSRSVSTAPLIAGRASLQVGVRLDSLTLAPWCKS